MNCRKMLPSIDSERYCDMFFSFNAQLDEKETNDRCYQQEGTKSSAAKKSMKLLDKVLESEIF